MKPILMSRRCAIFLIVGTLFYSDTLSSALAQDNASRYQPIHDYEAARYSTRRDRTALDRKLETAKHGLADARQIEAAASQANNAAALQVARQAIAVNQATLDSTNRELARQAQLERSRAEQPRAICAGIPAQLASDRRAVETQGQANKTSVAELEAWTRRNEKAAVDMAKDITKAIAGQLIANKMAAVTEKIKELQKQSDSLRGAGKNAATKHAASRLYGKMGPLAKKINASQDKLNELKNIETLNKDSEKIWTLSRNTISVVLRELVQHNEEVRMAVEDPELQKIMGDDLDTPGLDVMQALLRAATNDVLNFAFSATQYAPLVGTTMRLGQAAIDLTFHSTVWYQSFQRIQQQAALGESNAAAALALQEQYEKTFKAQAACRRLKFLNS